MSRSRTKPHGGGVDEGSAVVIHHDAEPFEQDFRPGVDGAPGVLTITVPDGHPAIPQPSPAPTPAELTAAVVDAMDEVETMASEAKRATRDLTRSQEMLARAIDAKARNMGAGLVLDIRGDLYRPKRPRKPRGGVEDPNALWTLEKVEVAG